MSDSSEFTSGERPISADPVEYRGSPPEEGGGMRPWAWSELACWVVILAAVVGVFYFGMKQKQGRVISKGPQLLMSARYAVGVGILMPQLKEQLLGELEKTAESPTDKVRVAIVRGELQNSGAAVARLEDLGRDHAELREGITSLTAIYNKDGVPAESISMLREHYGWFADLALSKGLSSDDPLRVSTLRSAWRVVGGLAAIVVFGLTGAATGLILLIVAIFLVVTKRLKSGFAAPPEDRRSYLQAFTLYVVGMATFGLALRYLLGWTSQWTQVALPLAFIPALFWPRLMGQTWEQWRATLGLNPGRGLFREIFAGIIGYLAGLPLMVIALIITAILVKLSHADASHPAAEELLQGRISPLWLFLLACVYAPITEELMFRGALFAHLRERGPWWLSAATVALLFAAIHPQGWAAIPILGSIALVLAGIREWRGSIIGCVTAHALNNGVALGVTLLMR